MVKYCSWELQPAPGVRDEHLKIGWQHSQGPTDQGIAPGPWPCPALPRPLTSGGGGCCGPSARAAAPPAAPPPPAAHGPPATALCLQTWQVHGKEHAKWVKDHKVQMEGQGSDMRRQLAKLRHGS